MSVEHGGGDESTATRLMGDNIDTNALPVVVNESCYRRCSKLSGKIMELTEKADKRRTDELALICEGGSILRRCPGIVVRTEELTTVVAGPFFGERNADERNLYDIALAQNCSLPVVEAITLIRH